MDHVNISRPINADSEMRTKLSSLVRNENDEQSKTELQNILTLLQSDDKEVVDKMRMMNSLINCSAY